MQTTVINEVEYRLLQTKVTRREEEFGHSYWSDEHGWLVGVTTLLGMAIPKDEGLINYFKRGDPYEMEEHLNETSAQGTRVHQAVELLLLGEAVPATMLKTNKEKRCVASFIEWYRVWKPTEVQSEQVVAYIENRPDTMPIKYAGTLDILCKIDGVWCVIDLKTGRASDLNHGLQIRAYGEAVKQSKGIKVEKYFALYLGTQHRTNAKNRNTLGMQKSGMGWNTEESTYTWEDFVRVYDYAMFLNKGTYPNPPVVQVFPETFKLLGDMPIR